MALSQYTRFRDRYMGRAIRTPELSIHVAWFDQRENSIVGRELYDHRVDSDENDNLASTERTCGQRSQISTSKCNVSSGYP